MTLQEMMSLGEEVTSGEKEENDVIVDDVVEMAVRWDEEIM